MKKIPAHRSWYVNVLKTEEKGSDVNLAVQLVNDAWQNKFDCAVVCSNDGDLADAVRIVRRERHKSVVITVPGDPLVRPASVELRRWASKTMHTEIGHCDVPATEPHSQYEHPQTDDLVERVSHIALHIAEPDYCRSLDAHPLAA